MNSTVRAFRGVGGTPVFVASGKGARMTDVDGNAYVDYVMSWGPLILGHAHPAVVEAIVRAAERGTSYGAPTDAESELAELVVAMVPSVEKVRFCSSGTEATTAALRLARGVTGREKIVKFAGCYHGATDALLVSAGSSALTIGKPDSAGVTRGTVHDTIVVPYNDLEAVRGAFAEFGPQIAAIVVEPYVGNMGLVLPLPGFLAGLREVTQAAGALLIFDEVMTGFRVAPGGVQDAKASCPTSRRSARFSAAACPWVRSVAGRTSSTALPPTATSSKRARSRAIRSRWPPASRRSRSCARPASTKASNARARARSKASITSSSGTASRIKQAFRGSMIGFFFTGEPVVDLASAKTSDTILYAQFFHAMLDRGIYLAPSQFEAGFISTAHDDATIDATIAAADDAMEALYAANGSSARVS